MNAVRYCSKTGHTKTIADAIAEGIGVTAVSITDEPELTEHLDVLFLGGAPYANIMAPELRKYAEGLTPEMVGKVVLFSTSNWSRRTVTALKKLLRDKGIQVEDEYLYSHFSKVKNNQLAAQMFGKKHRS